MPWSIQKWRRSGQLSDRLWLASYREPSKALDKAIFKLAAEEENGGLLMKYVIIGNSAAGNAAARSIVSKDPGAETLIFSDEPHESYYRPLLPNLLDETVEEKLLFRDESTEPQGIEKRLGQRVKGIDPQEKRITLEGGEQILYDRLLIATGSSPLRPPVEGVDAEGVYTMRTLDDAIAIKKAAEETDRVVIIGGGRVGMKTASVLKNRDLDVTVVEKRDYLVPLQFDRVAGEISTAAVQEKGINLILGQCIRAVMKSNGRVRAVSLEDGQELPTQLVVMATGVSANTELAQTAGIAVNQGIIVDPFMRTSVPDIFAAGDVVETTDIVTNQPIVSGLWTNAVEMGTIAGRNMTGEEADYGGAFGVLNALELADIPTVSVGLVDPPSRDDYEIHAVRHGDHYRKLVLKQGVLVGALLVGDIEGAGVYTGLIKRKFPVEPHLEALMGPRPSYASWLLRESQVNP
jgi:nitrite reductase (NADH) large subunit